MSDTLDICFAGKFVQTVDTKRRISVPSFFLTQIPSKVLHITRGPDSNLFVYPREVFLEMAARINQNFGGRGEADREKRLYIMETLGDAQPVQCDQQGRITVPQEFLDYGQMDSKVLILGQFNKLVFWNPELFEQFKQSSRLTSQQRVEQFGWAEGE